MSYSSEVLADSPLAYWRLGEASGTTAADSSGNGHNGTYNGPPTLGTTGLLVGDSNTAMTTAADTGQYVGVPSAAWMNVNTVTIEGWAKFAAYDGTNGDPICSRYTAGDNYPFFLGRAYGGSAAASAQLLVNGTRYTVSGPSAVPNDTVHHYALTYDGTTIRLYFDGSQIASQAISGTIGWSTSPFEIARYSQSNGTVPAAVIDEVAIYGTALSAARILAHYNAGTTAPSTSGTASLSLSASGSARATGAGTASLSLSASGGASAPAAGTASLNLSATGSTVAPTPAAGTASLALSASGAAAASAAGTASLSLLATATAQAILAASGTATLSLTASGSAIMTSGGTAYLNLTASGIAVALYTTDTSNNRHGRRRLGFATVTVTRPVAAPPDTLTLATKVDKAVAYPAPTMVNGRPT